MKLSLLILFCIYFNYAYNQQTNTTISNIFKGKLIGFGFNTGGFSSQETKNFNIDCSDCTEFDNVYLIAYEFSSIKDNISKSLLINGIPIILSNDTRIGSWQEINIGFGMVHFKQINDILNSCGDISITVPDQNAVPIIQGYYLVVECKNNLSQTISYNIILNSGDSFPDINYSSTDVLNINPINISNDFGLSLVGLTMNYMNGDASIMTFNGNQIGILAGQDLSSSSFLASGVRGHFSYINGILSGLDDDTPDNLMNATDALADVQEYLINNSSIYFSCFPEDVGNNSNHVEAVVTTYTTTCDTFSVSTTPDTSICLGETLQLSASGGQTYEWLPATNLGCSDCPNPIFTGDSSMFYTVRIWNNDSCSVVKPVKVNVRPKPQFGTIGITPTICGTNSGQVSLSAVSGTQAPLTYSMNSGAAQGSGTFSNLGVGIYNFELTDAYGCVSEDTMISIPQNNPTIAQFSLDPTTGKIPLTVSVTNTSVFATDFSWSLNGTDQGSSFSSFTCDTSGVYTVQLIAWQYDPSCADTFSLSVIALEELIIPTAFTPDNDGVNDVWEIPNIKKIYPDHVVQVYDRWGMLLYEAPQGKYGAYPWKGRFEDKDLPVGSYYFMIDPNDGESVVLKGVVSIVRL